MSARRSTLGRMRMLGVGLGLTLGLGIGASVAAPAGDALQQLFQQGNEHYRAARFAETADSYRLILKSGLVSGPTYYNLGNALLKSGRKGEALWAYLEARSLMPRDPDVAANLQYALSLLPPATAELIRPPLTVRVLTLGERWTLRELLAAWAVLAWLAAIAWILAGWWPRLRRPLRPAAWALTLLAAWSLAALLGETWWSGGSHRAGIVNPSVDVRFSPQDTGTTHFTLAEGSVISALDEQAGWIQIRRADGRAGWVPADSVRRL